MKYIQEAVESVFAQTYDQWELLLVDDGSTDKSTEIAIGYAKQHPDKVGYLQHRGHANRGMSASRNLGISRAKGKYITFLDADDVWLPRKLEQQVTIMESRPEVALICGRAEWWYSWTGNSADIQRDFLQKIDVPLNTSIKPPAVLVLFLQNEWASLCDILVRCQVAEAVGGYEDSFRGMYEDQVFQGKLCLEFPAYVSSQCWYRYRQHPNACTSRSHQTGQTRYARRTFLNWLEKYLLERNFEDTDIWQVVQNQLRPYRQSFLSRISRNAQRPIKSIKGLSKRLVQQLLES